MMKRAALSQTGKARFRYGVWVALWIVAVIGGLCLLGKFHGVPRRAFSTPPFESFPMPPSTPDRG